ncbi:hypothetical protein MMC16_005064 [Acarospora aff. strigata]|nr:hypothetical protein [Acarospora aff. strigata]
MQITKFAGIAILSLFGTTFVSGAVPNHVAGMDAVEVRAVVDGDFKAHHGHEAEYIHEYNLSPRHASDYSTVTVTVTTVPDYCSTVSAPAIASLSGMLPIPTGGIYPVPKNFTALMGTGTAPNTRTATASQTLTLVSATTTSPPIASATSNDAPTGTFSILLLVVTIGVAVVHSAVLA